MSIKLNTLDDVSFVIKRCSKNGLGLMMLFHLENCPHCIKMNPEWHRAAKLQKSVIFTDIECSENKSEFKRVFNIETFPHIVFCNKNGFQKLNINRDAESIANATR